MKIILTQNVPNLGSLGDEVQVKGGYARNFLLPKGMAMPAGGKNAKEIQHRQHILDIQRQEAINAAKDEADKVRALELVVKARSGTGGRLFGSITNRDLQAVMAEQGFELDRKAIQFHTLVKSLGTFSAQVKLHTDVKIEIQFKVESSEVVVEPTEGEIAAVEGEVKPEDAANAPLDAANPGEGAAEVADEPTSDVIEKQASESQEG